MYWTLIMNTQLSGAPQSAVRRLSDIVLIKSRSPASSVRTVNPLVSSCNCIISMVVPNLETVIDHRMEDGVL